jgi:hypothetical protein
VTDRPRRGGVYMDELDARFAALADLRHTITYCAACPGWRFEGTALEAREAFRDHRLEAHPGRAGDRPKPSGGGIGAWPRMTTAQRLSGEP